MCCFRLHFSDFNIMDSVIFQKNKNCSLLLKKITCCAKKREKITCHDEKSKPAPGYQMVHPLLQVVCS